MTPAGINASVTMTPNMPGWEHHTSLPAPSPSSSGPRYLVAKTDADILQLLDPTTLEPLAASRYQDLNPALDGQLSAAHSCRDHSTGDFYNYSCKLGGRFPTYKIFRIGGKDGKVDVLAEVKDAPASYIHSFAMTDRFVILCVWQAHITQYVLLFLLSSTNRLLTCSILLQVWNVHHLEQERSRVHRSEMESKGGYPFLCR